MDVTEKIVPLTPADVAKLKQGKRSGVTVLIVITVFAIVAACVAVFFGYGPYFPVAVAAAVIVGAFFLTKRGNRILSADLRNGQKKVTTMEVSGGHIQELSSFRRGV